MGPVNDVSRVNVEEYAAEGRHLRKARAGFQLPNLILHCRVSSMDRIQCTSIIENSNFTILSARVGMCTRLWASSRSKSPRANCFLPWSPACIQLTNASTVNVVERMGLAPPTCFGSLLSSASWFVTLLATIFSHNLTSMFAIVMIRYSFSILWSLFGFGILRVVLVWLK